MTGMTSAVTFCRASSRKKCTLASPLIGGDDRGAAAFGETADVVDDLAPILVAERRVALGDVRDFLAGQIAAQDGVGGARIDVIRADQEEPADALRDQKLTAGMACCGGVAPV